MSRKSAQDIFAPPDYADTPTARIGVAVNSDVQLGHDGVFGV